jgi:xylose isomerase
MDLSYLPTIGHALAIAQLTSEPKRVGCLIETAHAILAGLDPADEIDFAMSFGKLWSVHLNDQNGLKFDQDKPFGSANLRVAFNQVRALEGMATGKKVSMWPLTFTHFARRKSSIGWHIWKTAGAPFCAWLKNREVLTKRKLRG